MAQSSLALLAAILCLAPGAAEALELRTYYFDITAAFHVDTPQTYDPVIAYQFATNVLFYNEGCVPDQTCCVALHCVTPVSVFGSPDDPLTPITEGDGYNLIDGELEWEALLNAYPTPQTKIVQDIIEDGVPLGGVTRRGTRNMIVTYDAHYRVWAHEFGHGIGLKGDCIDEPGQSRCEYFGGCTFMAEELPLSTDAVRLEQCQRFKDYPSDRILYFHCVASPVGTTFSAVGGNSQITLTWEEFSPSPSTFYILRRGDA